MPPTTQTFANRGAPPGAPLPEDPAGDVGVRPFAPSGGGALPALLGALRFAAFVLVTLAAAPVQWLLLRLPGRGKVVFARAYWGAVCRVMGLRVRVLGAAARRGLGSPGRPVVFACNHSSWLDVAVLGGTLHAPFVAKGEVGRWPVVRTVAYLGRTVFVSRRPRDTGRERDDMRERLRAGDDLVLFPEGTSSDGNRVLPFRSAFFSVAEPAEGVPAAEGPLVQPVSVVYDREAGLGLGRATRAGYAWYGDMDLAPHFWTLARRRGGARCTVWLHEPLDPATFPSRKALAAACLDRVAVGAAALRQGRAPADGGRVRRR